MADTQLYVISSPLQLVNAIEARDRFHSGQRNLLLFIYRKTIDIEQIKDLVDEQWSEVHYFRWSALSRLLYPLILRRLFRNHTNFNRVYLGYPYNIRAHLANTLSAENWLLDDGTFTLWLNDQLDSSSAEIWKSRRFTDYLFGRQVDTLFLKAVHFFTSYDIQPIQGQPVIKNDFRCLKCYIDDKTDGGDVLFIGTPVEGKMVSSTEELVHYMSQVKAFYPGRKVRYAAHRYEDLAQRQAQLSGLGIEVFRFGQPLEVEFFKSRTLPSEICSFTSSALGNLQQIYGFDARSFRIPDQSIPNEHRDVFRVLYSDLERRGIPITLLRK